MSVHFHVKDNLLCPMRSICILVSACTHSIYHLILSFLTCRWQRQGVKARCVLLIITLNHACICLKVFW